MALFLKLSYTAGLEYKLIDETTLFENLEKIKCAGRTINEYDQKIPSNLTAEEILIRSGNIGSVRIGQKIGIDKLKNFLLKIGILGKIDFEIPEIGEPLPFNWGKCKLATVSFGHGISTTPIQVAKAYAIISNGGYEIKPSLLMNKKIVKKKQIVKSDVSLKVNNALRKIVTSKDGTAEFATYLVMMLEVKQALKKFQQQVDIQGKVNTFVAIFPISNPKYVLVTLDEPKTSPDYIYKYRNKRKL